MVFLLVASFCSMIHEKFRRNSALVAVCRRGCRKRRKSFFAHLRGQWEVLGRCGHRVYDVQSFLMIQSDRYRLFC